ncbi:MAG: AraC family transcriptional regulator [Flavitalea sp.]
MKVGSEEKQSILYSCLYRSKIQREQRVDFHSLVYIQSGIIEFATSDGTKQHKSGDIILVRRNQLSRSEKIPTASGQPFKSIALFLEPDLLQKYAIEKNVEHLPVYTGSKFLDLTSNKFLFAFFQSLLPYYDNPEALTPALTELKSKEAIELLLRSAGNAREFLFDFSEPHKIDLESFMLKNFEFNVPVKEFARLSGRSISTFKRDFQKLFATTPEKWLKEQRLERAHYLIKNKKQKPADIYLRVGFENLSHFSTAFKEMFGVSPSMI